MKKYKNYFICFLVIIMILVITIFKEEDNASSLSLEDFKILEVKQIDNKVTLTFEKCLNATHYLVTVTDLDENILFMEDVVENSVSLQSIHAEYEQSVNISVIAFNDMEEQKNSSNTFTYKWQNPSFDDEENSQIVRENKDFGIKILGDIKDYNLKILYKNNVIYKIPLQSNYLTISYNVLKDYKGKLTAIITDNENTILHEMNFYNNPVIVSNVSITSPFNEEEIPWDNINLSFLGGDNATSYKVNIYKGKKKVRTMESQDKGLITIPSKYLEENTTYKLELLAIYSDYEEIAKRDYVIINVLDKRSVSPVITNYNPDNIKSGTYISLLSKTENATIKYTTDGSNPLRNGKIYKEPIRITNNVEIKAVALKDGLENSPLTSFDFKINNKIPVIYLSPSRQEKNIGILEVGYTTEKEMMNKLCDKLEVKLRNQGFIVYRNDPEKDMMEWLNESRSVNASLHLAIHSNGSTNHDTKGMEIYVDDVDSKMLSLATIMYSNLYEIYPYKSSVTNRGVKYALGSLGEVKKENTSRGVLIEIAHHDDIDDAKWMVDNLEEISNNIANSIISYYGLG